MNTRLFWSIGWGLMTLMCLLFAPIAAEFYWTTVNATTATYAQLLALTVSESYAYGEGSGFAEMTPHWREMPHLNQLVLGVHAVLASVALVIGPFLFVGRIRHRWPQVHRRLGQSYVSLVVVAMILSAVYLLLTPMDRIYGGPPFAVGLWGIGFLTTYTALAGTWHILRGEQEAHRSVMILNFSAMLIAPLLRGWWLVLGAVLTWIPGVDQSHTHVIALMILGVETMIGAILVVHATRGRGEASEAIRRVGNRLGAAMVRIRWAGWGLGVATAGLFLHQRFLRFVVDGWAPARSVQFADAEKTLFLAHPSWFLAEAVGLALLVLLIPTLFVGLYRDGRVGRGAVSLVVALAAGVSSVWLAQATALARLGTFTWGDAACSTMLAGALLVCTGGLAYGVRAGRADLIRTFVLHVYALALTPAFLFVQQLGFLAAGFTPEDAFLSAAVLAPSLMLSSSYYYTVYGDRRRAPSPVAPMREETRRVVQG